MTEAPGQAPSPTLPILFLYYLGCSRILLKGWRYSGSGRGALPAPPARRGGGGHARGPKRILGGWENAGWDLHHLGTP